MTSRMQLLDDNLTVSKVGTIFTQVNVSSEEVEGGDEEEAELVFDEFLQVVVRLCDAKIPPANRENGEEFVFTLQRCGGRVESLDERGGLGPRAEQGLPPDFHRQLAPLLKQCHALADALLASSVDA